MIASSIFYHGREVRPIFFPMSIALLVISIFLLRGNLDAASWMRWLAIVSMPTAVVAFDYLLSQPFSLTLKQFQGDFSYGGIWVVQDVLLLGLLFYAYRQLGNAAVKAACDAAMCKRRNMRIACVAGLVLAAGVIAAQFMMANSEVVTRARLAAEQRHGKNYQYHMLSIRRLGTPKGDYDAVMFAMWNAQGWWQIVVWCPVK